MSEVGKKEYFFRGPILAAAFHEKSHAFLCFLLSTHSKAEDSEHICVHNGQKNRLQTFHCTELQ
jgi:hypothetical protein